MVKTFVLDKLLVEWFINSLFPSIIEDVEKDSVVIARAQYLDLIYTQSGMLYEKIPKVSRPNFIVPLAPSS